MRCTHAAHQHAHMRTRLHDTTATKSGRPPQHALASAFFSADLVNYPSRLLWRAAVDHVCLLLACKDLDGFKHRGPCSGGLAQIAPSCARVSQSIVPTMLTFRR